MLPCDEEVGHPACALALGFALFTSFHDGEKSKERDSNGERLFKQRAAIQSRLHAIKYRYSRRTKRFPSFPTRLSLAGKMRAVA